MIIMKSAAAGLLAGLLAAGMLAPVSASASQELVGSAGAADSSSFSSASGEARQEAAARQETIPDGQMKSRLTGEYVSEEEGMRRPVAFMIDNVKDADPPSGISSASVYYECEVESDLSRICAVFGDGAWDQEGKIGPLRSCRDYFISLVAGLDPIYEHYGQAAYALPYLESDDVDNISGLMSYSYDAFYRDGPHAAPHNAYTSGEGINTLIGELGYRTAYRDGSLPELTFRAVGDDVTPDGRDASYVALGYPFNQPVFTYHAEDGCYFRSQYGHEHTDLETGSQLYVKNIILEYQNAANYQNSSYKHYETTGSGKGKYITNGKAVDITWERDSFYSPVVYRTADGNVLRLNPGKTWVAVIRKDQLNQCRIGADESSASAVEDAGTIAEQKQEMDAWVSEYKAGEEAYLSKMAQQRSDNVAKHGGTKVEVGLS